MKSVADNTIDVFRHAVDLEVIKQRTHEPSETTGARDDFRNRLAERDGYDCVWSGLGSGVGMHIIPHRRGDEACIPCILVLHVDHLRSGFGSSLEAGQSITKETLAV
jgi:hypothetical protein